MFSTLSGGHARLTHTPMSATPRNRETDAPRQGKARAGETHPTRTDTLTPDTQTDAGKETRHWCISGHRDGAFTWRHRGLKKGRRAHERTQKDPGETKTCSTHTHTHTSKGETQGASQTHAVTHTRGLTRTHKETAGSLSPTHAHTHSRRHHLHPCDHPQSRARSPEAPAPCPLQLPTRLPQEKDPLPLGPPTALRLRGAAYHNSPKPCGALGERCGADRSPSGGRAAPRPCSPHDTKSIRQGS